MVYDPNGSNNSSLLSLVAGTITFVAGETAKHGDMKIDTPVATMGIRGTAVLFAVHFKLPNGVLLPDGQDPPPDAVPEGQFQVLVEPDGTSGSYILFEKTTLTPYVVVDKPGLQINITSGNVTQTLTQLSPEVQKLITDVFTLKFSDSSNTKTLDHFTDSIIPQTFAPTMLAFGPPVTPTGPVVNTQAGSSPTSGTPQTDIGHIGQAPSATSLSPDGHDTKSFQTSELFGKTGDTADFDTVSGRLNFSDINLGDRPTVSSKFESFAYTDAHGNVVPLNAQQVADVTALELNLTLKPDSGNLNTGSVLWTYNDPTNPLSIPDKAFDFLAAGEKLQLTYWLTVDNNFAPADQTTTVPITITITGTNDVPVIATGAQTIKFAAGTSTTGGDLIPGSSTSGVLVNKSTSPGGTPTATETGTFTFTDPDLTDTHSIVLTSPTGDLTGASLSGTTLDLTALESKYPGPFQIFETALSASLATDSTGTGTGTINWTLAELPVYVADFIPSGETLALTYTIEVKDSQGAISTQTITVNITGTDNPAEVWIATVPQGATPGGLWSKASNWETGNVPTATDDVIIITNQLLGLTPSYPATIDAATNAVAKTVTLNDFSDLGNAHPELIVQGTLTIGGTFDVGADSTVENSGTITVGGPMEISNTSVLQNDGQLTLQDGGGFKDQTSITNSGTIELSGGTLDVEVAVANAGGKIKVDGPATLKLNGAAINGGTITDDGTIDVTADSSINGTTAGAPPVTTYALLNNGAVTVESGVTLTLDNVTVTGTTFTDIASSSTIKVDSGDTLKLNGAAINGGTITDNGTIDVTADSSINGTTAGVPPVTTNALLNNGAVTVESGVTLTLDNVTVTGTTFTDTSSGAILSVDATDTLTLSGVTIHGGTINDGTGNTLATAGTIEISGSSTISSANLNHGGVTVDGTVTLTLDNDTVTGTTFTDTASGAILSVD
ncbi:MAG: hypothetical protein P4L86_12345, partial [Mycobacterium sp.]|nr:hypothetical protein [Mycobacterium sp.]